MTKPNKIAPNWRSPETLILDFSRCITSNMTTNNKAPVAMPEKEIIYLYFGNFEKYFLKNDNLPFTIKIYNSIGVVWTPIPTAMPTDIEI